MVKKKQGYRQCKVCFLCKKGEDKNTRLNWFISDKEALVRFIRNKK